MTDALGKTDPTDNRKRKNHIGWGGVLVHWETIPEELRAVATRLQARLASDAEKYEFRNLVSVLAISGNTHSTIDLVTSHNWLETGEEAEYREPLRRIPNDASPLFPVLQYAFVAKQFLEHCGEDDSGIPEDPIKRDAVVVSLDRVFAPKTAFDPDATVEVLAEIVAMEILQGLLVRQQYPARGTPEDAYSEVQELIAPIAIEAGYSDEVRQEEVIRGWLRIFYEVLVGKRFADVFPLPSRFLVEALHEFTVRIALGSRPARAIREGFADIVVIQALIWAATLRLEESEQESDCVIEQLVRFFGISAEQIQETLEEFGNRLASTNLIVEKFKPDLIVEIIEPLVRNRGLTECMLVALKTPPHV